MEFNNRFKKDNQSSKVNNIAKNKESINVNLDDIIDKQDVLLLLHISERTLFSLRRNGTMPYTKIGKKIFYFKSDIVRILKNNYVMFNLKRYGFDK